MYTDAHSKHWGGYTMDKLEKELEKLRKNTKELEKMVQFLKTIKW